MGCGVFAVELLHSSFQDAMQQGEYFLQLYLKSVQRSRYGWEIFDALSFLPFNAITGALSRSGGKSILRVLTPTTNVFYKLTAVKILLFVIPTITKIRQANLLNSGKFCHTISRDPRAGA